MPHDDFSDRKGVSEGQNADQLGPSHQGQPRATILAIYGRAVGDRATLTSEKHGRLRRLRAALKQRSKIDFNRSSKSFGTHGEA